MNNKDNLTMAPSADAGAMVMGADEVSVSRDFEVRLTAVETELKHVAKKSEVSEIKSILIEMKENMATKADLEMLKADIERNNTRIENLKFWVVSYILGGMTTLSFLFFAYYEIFGGKQ